MTEGTWGLELVVVFMRFNRAYKSLYGFGRVVIVMYSGLSKYDRALG